jgi:hypothetical protein
VVDRGRAAGAVGGAPGDAGGQLGRLAAGEVGLAAVEEDLDRLVRREELEPAEEREPLHPLRAADSGEGAVELDPNPERGAVAGVRDDEEEQPPLEDDVDDHLAVVARLLHAASLRRAGHSPVS